MEPDLADALRYVGTGCQFVGFLLAAWSIRRLRSGYTRRRGIVRTVVETSRGAWARVTGRPRTTVVVHGIDAAVGRETARPVRARTRPTEIERRIAELERVVQEQDERVDELERAIDAEVTDREAALDAERRGREQGDRAIAEELEGLADVTAGPGAAVGVGLFSLGVLLAGIPEELASWWRAL